MNPFPLFEGSVQKDSLLRQRTSFRKIFRESTRPPSCNGSRCSGLTSPDTSNGSRFSSGIATGTSDGRRKRVERERLEIRDLDHMPDRLRWFQEEIGNFYNLEGTPAKSAGLREGY